ncbi:hypothetical protein HD806DRAFT_513914 [Xylariaceae sp. AK1471]|nr:hypothetical protein HD806DRAFT_513914 [Xylariaceae sp. AK1471]
MILFMFKHILGISLAVSVPFVVLALTMADIIDAAKRVFDFEWENMQRSIFISAPGLLISEYRSRRATCIYCCTICEMALAISNLQA